MAQQEGRLKKLNSDDVFIFKMGSEEILFKVQNEDNFVSALDYDGSNQLLYTGKALPGSSKASALWQIKKYLYSGSNLTDIQYADGNNNYDNIWNDRTTYTYS